MEAAIIRQQLTDVALQIWRSILERDLRVSERRCEELPEQAVIHAVVHVSGAWEGSVSLTAPTTYVEEIAEKMFAAINVSPDMSDVEDALRELTNMIGGNLKTVLPEPCVLSTPEAVHRESFQEESGDRELKCEQVFEADAVPIIARVWAK